MLTYQELGTFAFSFRTRGVHGMGLSASSSFSVCYAGAQYYLKYGAPLCSESIAAEALRMERSQADGLALAADDVYPIVAGGVVRVRTAPDVYDSGQLIRGDVHADPVAHDPRFLAEHVVVAFDRAGVRHDIPQLLRRLVTHRSASRYIDQFSSLAEAACSAIAENDISKLSRAVNAYRSEFDNWTSEAYGQPVYTRGVCELAAELLAAFPDRVLGWKPPGGGASASIMVLCPDVESRDAVIRFLQAKAWCALPALVTQGVYGEFMNGEEIRISAGHRCDFIGASDLGSDVAIGRPGCCCSAAIEPRSEILLSSR